MGMKKHRIVFVLLLLFLFLVACGCIVTAYAFVSGLKDNDSDRISDPFSSTNTPEEMFLHIVEDPIPVEIFSVEGNGDTWQGHNIYLKIIVKESTYFDKFLAIHKFKKTDCAVVDFQFELSAEQAKAMPYWGYQSGGEYECYESNGYSNSWTSSASGYVAIDRSNMIIYLREIGI